MTESMFAKFNSYWANVNVVMAVVAILDLGYKMKLLEFYYPNIYGNNFDLEIEKKLRIFVMICLMSMKM